MYKLRMVLMMGILLADATYLRAEYVFLKDGSIHEGKIINDTAAAVTMQPKQGGAVKKFNRTQVMRILYTEIYLGKHFIRLNTGEMIEAYQVDEDSENLTFRKDLTSPQEFTIKRSNVLFMTRTNPTGLEGKPNLKEITLTWIAPFQAPRYYQVYMKERKEDTYRLIGKTASRKYKIKELESKKTFYFIVTAVGIDGNESVPSNEIKIRTNIPPLRPPGGMITVLNEKNKGTTSDIRITWRSSADPDGMVTGYRIYQRRQFTMEKIEETAETHAMIPEVALDRDNHFMIRAVDDDGAESASRTASLLLRRISVTANTGCLLPLQNFGALMYPGSATALNISVGNVLINYFSTGIEIGYARMNCKISRSYALTMVPITAVAAYRFELSPLFSLTPHFSLGISYLVSHVVRSNLYTIFEPKNKDGVDPLITLGLSARFQVIDLLSTDIYLAYGVVFEKKPMDYLIFSAGLTARFNL